ncbi:hypothetical protein [Skermania piniformis]|uniref:Uncharacterized protein n=1 Tax=Skermania pinensis TaxID=39122 RepID=A0ABX8SA14_9ACTN|nr:hypothetical protein [Skermania piniformis]QXQ14306.1 hypothetical protein KV203_02400 [Skermania piniformis]
MTSGSSTSTSGSDLADQVSTLRGRVATEPVAARDDAWNLIVGLQELAKSDHETADTQLNELFRLGAPVAGLDGPTDGILVTTTTNPVTDAALKMLTSVWMPWQGKSFDAANASGTNRMTDGSARQLKLLWPLYSMTDTETGKLAFGFKTYIQSGKDDPDRQVMVIDYADVESNPRLVIRSIRDELVELVPGAYLGKVLIRLPADRYAMIGYFALRSDAARG